MKRALIPFLLLLSFCSAAQLKDTVFTRPPRVGLVLSGGGAKGYAHLPVIKAIEEAGIKIDFVAGTSIGSIIGGLMATGYSAVQIDSMARSMDMMAMVRNSIDRSQRPYYYKKNEGKTWFQFGFNGFKIAIPSGLSSGQHFINALCDWTVPVHGISDFDSLPVPYFCKVTNLSEGRGEKLDGGVLAEAIRASSSYPSLFNPFVIDGKTYIDGGVYDNYPVEDMRAMGADIIIGVDINSGLGELSNTSSIIQILEQLVGFQILENVNRQKHDVDVSIHPDMDDFNALSFSSVDSIYVVGERTVMNYRDELKQIADLQRKWGIEYGRKEEVKLSENFMISDIIFKGNTHYTGDYILGRFDMGFPIRAGLGDIKRGIERLYATGNFINVYYQLLPNKARAATGDGAAAEYTLELTLIDNPSNQYIGLGWSFDNLYKSRILFNYTVKNLVPNSMIELDLVLGTNLSFDASFFLDRGYKPSFGADINIGGLKGTTYFSRETAVKAEPAVYMADINLTNVTANLYMQSTLKQMVTGGFGIELSYMDFNSPTIFVDNKNLSIQKDFFVNPYVYLNMDTRDDKFMPTKGLYYDIMFKLVMQDGTNEGNMVSIPSFFKGYLSNAFRMGGKFTMQLDGFAGIAFGQELPPAYRFVIGGVRNIMPFNFVEFYGLPFFWNTDVNKLDLGANSVVRLAGKLTYRPWKSHNFFAGYNAGVYCNDNSFFKNSNFIQGAGIGYGLNTPVGPVQIMGIYSPNAHGNSRFGWMLSAGFNF